MSPPRTTTAACHPWQLCEPRIEFGEADAHALDLGDPVGSPQQSKAARVVEFDQIVTHLIVGIEDEG